MKAITDSGYKFIPQTVRKYYKYNDTVFTNPVLSWNGLLGGASFAVAGANYSSYEAWHLFDGNTSTIFVPSARTGAIGDTHLIFYNPDPLKITRFTMTNRNTNVSAPRAGSVYFSNNGLNWYPIPNSDWVNDVTTSLSTWYIDFVNNNYYNYYKIQFTSWDYSSAAARALAEISLSQGSTNLTMVRTIIEGTESDYDFYEDVVEYKAVA